MKLPSCITIDSIQAVANELKLLSGDESTIELDFSGVVDIDLAGIQLLVALIKEAKRKKRRVSGSGALSPALKARFGSCGYDAESLVSGQDLVRLFESLV
jgi:anti-anti-sigma regulatory factor